MMITITPEQLAKVLQLKESIEEALDNDCEVNISGNGVNAYEAVVVIDEVLKILDLA